MKPSTQLVYPASSASLAACSHLCAAASTALLVPRHVCLRFAWLFPCCAQANLKHTLTFLVMLLTHGNSSEIFSLSLSWKKWCSDNTKIRCYSPKYRSRQTEITKRTCSGLFLLKPLSKSWRPAYPRELLSSWKVWVRLAMSQAGGCRMSGAFEPDAVISDISWFEKVSKQTEVRAFSFAAWELTGYSLWQNCTCVHTSMCKRNANVHRSWKMRLKTDLSVVTEGNKKEHYLLWF